MLIKLVQTLKIIDGEIFIWETQKMNSICLIYNYNAGKL